MRHSAPLSSHAEAALRAELASQCEGEVFQVREELRAEVERHHHQLQSVAAQRQREVRRMNTGSRCCQQWDDYHAIHGHSQSMLIGI